jgi:hypothetical protein
MVKIKMSNTTEISKLLSAEQYEKLTVSCARAAQGRAHRITNPAK